ncbi:MAG TPA: right-handed parallel beta-helix repeat-containing protein, partial [Candidatus Sumerlaeota bacterium]|nr:right-handed parallel beta-helix repeat-containing protein [Candidatus Sumerlaeota bacterium]
MKNSRRILSVVICLVLFASLAQAKKFSDPPAGQGVSTVGTIPGSDYATLAQAAADFNGLAGGCTGDWTLLINSDLTEPANVPFGNSTNGYMVTMRPAPGVEPVVSMTAATVGTVPGHLIIGAGAANSFGALIKTDNFTINGCSDDAFSTRSLTFINNNAAIVNSRLILVVGDSDNVTIKNCHITNRSTRDTALSCVGVEFLSRTDGVNDFIPDNGTVQNCAITARGASSGTGRYGTGVKQTNSGIITSGRAQTGFKVMDCDIQARYVGVFLGQTAGATVSNNRIRLNQYYPTQQIYGIYHVNANGASG